MDRLGRFAPLTGVAFVVLAVISIIASSSTPNSNASGLKVISFYEAHRSSQRLSDILLAVAFVFFVFFVASIYDYLRSAPPVQTLALVALGGSLMFAVGFAIFAGIDFSLADTPSKLTPAAARALNLINNDLVFPFAVGSIVFGVATGLAIVRSRLLPAWIGWVVLVLGILAGTPVGIVGLFGLLIWSAVVSILIYLRGARATAERPAVAPAPV